MPMRVHISQTTARPARAERSLLRELGLPLSIGAHDASDHGAATVCASLFLAAMQHRGLVFVERIEVPRVDARLAELEQLGDVELALGWEHAHDVLLTLACGSLALLTSHGGTCEIVVAARSLIACAPRHRPTSACACSSGPPAAAAPRCSGGWWTRPRGTRSARTTRATPRARPAAS